MGFNRLKIKMTGIKYFLCFSICLVFMVSPECFARGAYKLSMLPRYYPQKIKGMINPFAQHISDKTGIKIKTVLTADFTEYETSINSGKIEIGYENPLVYTAVSQVHEAVAMAIKGEGESRFRGIIITRPDSDIHSFGDLKHKKIMIVGKTSAGGFLSQKLSLSENGIEVEKDCDLEEASNNKQENVIIAVSIGDADAGFIRESAFHVADPYIQPGSIMVMSTCAWLPNWAVSVQRTLPEATKSAIRSAILSLDKNSPVLKAMGVTGFKSAIDSDYDIIRSVLQ